MSALTTNEAAALAMALRNTTAFVRLSLGEVSAVLAQMTALGYVIQEIGSTGGSYIASQAEFRILADTLCSTTAMSRLGYAEALPALLAIQTLGNPILRPSAQGAS
jgi:hypothetical protein